MPSIALWVRRLLIAMTFIVIYAMSFRFLMIPYPAYDDKYQPRFKYTFRFARGKIFKDSNGVSVLVGKTHAANYFYFPIEKLLISNGKGY
jgi:hypothetical protein